MALIIYPSQGAALEAANSYKELNGGKILNETPRRIKGRLSYGTLTVRTEKTTPENPLGELLSSFYFYF